MQEIIVRQTKVLRLLNLLPCNYLFLHQKTISQTTIEETMIHFLQISTIQITLFLLRLGITQNHSPRLKIETRLSRLLTCKLGMRVAHLLLRYKTTNQIMSKVQLTQGKRILIHLPADSCRWEMPKILITTQLMEHMMTRKI
jgi:hypothetical protein